jgi:hypothetical protein
MKLPMSLLYHRFLHTRILSTATHLIKNHLKVCHHFSEFYEWQLTSSKITLPKVKLDEVNIEIIPSLLTSLNLTYDRSFHQKFPKSLL